MYYIKNTSVMFSINDSYSGSKLKFNSLVESVGTLYNQGLPPLYVGLDNPADALANMVTANICRFKLSKF